MGTKIGFLAAYCVFQYTTCRCSSLMGFSSDSLFTSYIIFPKINCNTLYIYIYIYIYASLISFILADHG